MGQAISKRFMPKIAKATKSRDAQLMQDAFDDIARKKAFAKVKGATYYDPSAQDAGFKRDTWRDEELTPRDKEQQIFLKNMAAANKNSVKNDDSGQISSQEMPEDLIKFLNDAGPLEKQVDESRTSPNVYESLKEEEEIRRQSEESAKLRKRRRMPMVENIEGMDSENNTTPTNVNVEGNNDEDGLTTMKTTNFSTATLEDDDSDLKLSDDEIEQFLARLRTHQISVEDYLAERHHNSAKEDAQSSIDETQKEKDLDLLKNTSKYVGIPVLMQDTDNSMVGAWERRVEDLKLMRLTFPRNDAKLILGSSKD